MPLNFCIPKEFIEDVKDVVTNTPSSIERNKILTRMFGEEGAAIINKTYEKNLLLKNPDVEKFVSKLSIEGLEKQQAMKDRIAERLLTRTQKIQDEELLSLAQDIWDRKYKIDIPLEDVQRINDVKIEIDAAKEAMIASGYGEAERKVYGDAWVKLKHIVDELKNPTEKMGIVETTKDILSKAGQRFSKEAGIMGNIGEALKLGGEIFTSAVYKSVQASMDMSYSLRQGMKIFTKSPRVWAQNWKEAFKPFANLKNKEAQQKVFDDFMSRVVSDPMYDTMIDAKLGIGVIEDFFPTTLAEKLPAIGNVFKASNEAFTIFSQGSRMGLFKEMYNTAIKNGIEITPQVSKDLAEMANSITGRGHLGALEKVSGTMNKIFYSARYIKSSIDVFWKPFDPKLAPIARQEAMKSSVRTVGMVGTLMYTASLFTDVEWNPLSSKFGKAKVPGSKDTWIDLTAGLGSYITLASKQAMNKYKSSKTGKISKLGDKYGAPTRFTTAVDWMSNKLAPAPSTIVQFMKEKDYEGKKPTITSAAINVVKPIAVGNLWQNIMSDNDLSAKMITSVFDILGASQTDYSKFK